jgi:hypothetical protein
LEFSSFGMCPLWNLLLLEYVLFGKCLLVT